MKRTIASVGKAAVSAVLFYFVFRHIAFDDLVRTVSTARIGVLLAAFTLVWAGSCLCVLRWQLLMNPLALRLPAARVFGIYCVGLFFNLALPTMVGGDIVRVYYAGKPSGRYTQAFAATFVDRAAGLAAMLAVAVAATLAGSLEIPGVPARAFVLSASAVFLVSAAAIFTPRVHGAFTRALTHLGRTRAAARIDSISVSFITVLRTGRSILGAVAFSLGNQLLVVVSVWLVSLSVGLSAGLGNYFLVVPVVALVTMLPVSVSGMGLREFAFVGVLGGLGASRTEAVAVGLLCSSFLVLSAIPGGIIYLFLRDRGDVARIAALETNLT